MEVDYEPSPRQLKQGTSEDQGDERLKKGSGLREFFKTIKLKEVARRLKILAPSTRFKYLKENHFLLINDNAIYFKSIGQNKGKRSEDLFASSQEIAQQAQNQIRQSRNLFIRTFNYLLEILPVFSPSHVIKDVWDIFQIFAYLILFFYIPIHVTFQIEFVHLMPSGFIYFLSLQICLDILVQLNTGFFDKGIAVKDRILITKHYCKNYLFKDLLSIIPFIIYSVSYPFFAQYKDYYPSSILLVFFIRFRRFTVILHRIEENFHMKPSTRNLINLFKVVFNIIFVSHIFSCLWIVVALEEQKHNSYGITWFDPLKIQNSDWLIKYLYAYYFSSVTMITVGYGDVIPKTPPELVLCIITMIIACGLFGYSLNQIGVIVQDVFKTETEIRENLYVITNYMNTKNINFDLQFQIRQYVEYYLREQSQNNTEMESKIINQLSDVLRESLKYESNKLVTNSPIFYNHFSQEVIQKMVPLIKEKRSTPEELIYIDNQLDDCCIYFIEKGTIDEIIDLNEQRHEYNGKSSKIKTIKSYEDGEYFGEVNFFTGRSRKQSARSRQFTKLLYIRREDFLNLIKDHREDYEVFCYLRDKLLLYNDLEVINKKCQSCYGYHHIDECQWVHYAPDKQKTVHRHLISFPQTRKKDFRRRRKLKYNSLIHNDFIKKKVVHYLEEKAQSMLEFDWYYDLMNMSDFTLNSEDEKIFQSHSSDGDADKSMCSIFKEDKSIYNQQNSDEDQKDINVHQKKQFPKSEPDLDEIGKERISLQNIPLKVKLKKECNKNSKNQNQNQLSLAVNEKSKLLKSNLLSPRDYSKSHQSELRRKSIKKKTTKILNNLQEQINITIQQSNDHLLRVDTLKNPQDKSMSSYSNQRIPQNQGKLNPNALNQQPLLAAADQIFNFFNQYNRKISPHPTVLQSPTTTTKQPKDMLSQQNGIAALINHLLQGINQPQLGNNINVNGIDQAQYSNIIDDAGFDVISQFKYYFPHGNFQSILDQMEKIAQFQSIMQEKFKNQYYIPNDLNSERQYFTKKEKQELFYNNSEDFSKRFSSKSITPSLMRKNLLNQKKSFMRQNEGIGRNQPFRQSLISAKAKPAGNSKIQNLIEKFKIEENSNQDNNDFMNVSTDLQNQKIMKRRQQIKNKMTMVTLPRLKKFSQGETQLFSPTSFQNLALKKKSQFDLKQSSLENSNVGLEYTGGNLSNRKDSYNTFQSQQNEEELLFGKQPAHKSPSLRSKQTMNKNGELITFNSNSDNNFEEMETPYQAFKKKSLFNQQKPSDE